MIKAEYFVSASLIARYADALELAYGLDESNNLGADKRKLALETCRDMLSHIGRRYEIERNVHKNIDPQHIIRHTSKRIEAEIEKRKRMRVALAQKRKELEEERRQLAEISRGLSLSYL